MVYKKHFVMSAVGLAAFAGISLGTLPQTSLEINTERDATINGYQSTSTTLPLQSGFAVTGGDVNGDGIDDLIIGTHHGYPNGVEAAGEAFVIFGPLSQSSYDLASSTNYDVHITNDIADERMSSSVAVGDINGDGQVDLVFGAATASPDNRMDAGKVYVFFGPLSAGTYTRAQDADIQLNGINPDDRAGIGTSIGDLNGDGFADLAIGARLADPGGRADAGQMYVLFGPLTNGTYNIATSADLIYNGITAGEEVGNDVAIGDLNNDGHLDLAAAAPFADPAGRKNAGKIYGIFGPLVKPSSQRTIEMSSVINLTFNGATANDVTNRLVIADLNQDSIPDLVAGAVVADVNNPTRVDAGRVYLLHGPFITPGTYDILSKFNVAYKGIDAGDNAGRSVGVGKIKGSSAMDLIIGAPLADPLGRLGSGETYVIEGPLP